MLNAVMKYQRTPLVEAVHSCARRVDGDVNNMLLSFAFFLGAPLSPKPKSFCESKVLKEEEKKEIDAFFDGLGKSDAYGQSEYLEYYGNIFEQSAAKARVEIAKKGDPAAKLGILLGILICVLTV